MLPFGSRMAEFTRNWTLAFHGAVVALQKYSARRGSLRAFRISISALPPSRSVPKPELVWNWVHMFRSDVAWVWNDAMSLAPVGSLMPFEAAAIAAAYAGVPSDSAVCM